MNQAQSVTNDPWRGSAISYGLPKMICLLCFGVCSDLGFATRKVCFSLRTFTDGVSRVCVQGSI